MSISLIYLIFNVILIFFIFTILKFCLVMAFLITNFG